MKKNNWRFEALARAKIVRQEQEEETKTLALKTLEEMPEPEFQEFFNSLPARTRLCCQGGLVDWKETLPQWFIKFQVEGRK